MRWFSYSLILKPKFPSGLKLGLLITTSLLLLACGGNAVSTPTSRERVGYENTAGTAFGPDGISFSSVDRSGAASGNWGSAAVNGFLWRASLETIGFMPLLQVDPFGGVVLTDWASIGNNDTERYKINIFIFGSVLRADALKVKVFKQIQAAGGWRDTPVNDEIANKLEQTILDRARSLRVASQNLPN